VVIKIQKANLTNYKLQSGFLSLFIVGSKKVIVGFFACAVFANFFMTIYDMYYSAV
jgi:hypothetical protein